jgi:hypothetical protein
VFGGAGIGALLGGVSMELGFGLVEGVLHLFGGFFAGSFLAEIAPWDDGDGLRAPAASPWWARALFWIGLAAAIAIIVAIHWG